MTNLSPSEPGFGDAGSFGVNYALRPHKFVDRRVFMEIIARFSNFSPVYDYIYVGLGSFALEDHKLMHTNLGIPILISLERNRDVYRRQKFNTPLSCIKATQFATGDFIIRRLDIFEKFGAQPEANAVIWFDMTDADNIRVHLDSFGDLLRSSQPGDIVRMTVDVDEKTFGRRTDRDDESPGDLMARRFATLRELLGDELLPGASVQNIESKLGIAKLVLYAFRLVAERAFELNRAYKFEPLSLTTYADGHRMLSVTGVVIERDRVPECRTRMHLNDVPDGVEGWDDLVSIQLPQLTVWEKLTIDRSITRRNFRQLNRTINFRLHDTVPTTELLQGYSEFQRFYPTFRHVLL